MKIKKPISWIGLMLISILAFASILWGSSMLLTANAATAEGSDLSFVLDSETQEYKVRIANKTATEVVIPSTYEGLPVTAIDDSGFMGCTALEQILVPESIKTIGKNAFMGCTKLKKVLGMSGVESYGANAFAMCSNLEYLILPSDLKSVGSTMLRNVKATVYSRTSEEKMTQLSSTWASSFQGNIVYGNTLVYEEYDGGLTLASFQNINYESNTQLVIFNYLKDGTELTEENYDPKNRVLNISQYAFAGSVVDSIVIKNAELCNHTINIQSYAFWGCQVQDISIETAFTLNDDETETGISEALFLDCKAETITLSDAGITEIPYQTFLDCSNLRAIQFIGDTEYKVNHLSTKITRINDSAFYNCTSLPELYISDTIEYIGSAAFFKWGTNTTFQNIYIDLLAPSSNWNVDWRQQINESNCNVEFTAASTFDITFVGTQDGVVNPTGNVMMTVDRNSTLSGLELNNPTSTSHNFNGKWYIDEERTQEFPDNKPIKENLTLYAGWTIKEFTISFTSNAYVTFKNVSGESITEETLEYGEIFHFAIATKNGYKNYEVSFNNQLLTVNDVNLYTITATENGTVSASADLEYYTITYENMRGGTNPNTVIRYTVESETIHFINPTWEAYENGTWSIMSIPQGSTGDKVITAIWTNPVSFTITYDNVREGTNPNTVTTYTVESDTINFINPTWEAYDNGSWDIASIPKGSTGNKVITAIWTNPVVYTISYANLKDGSNPNTVNTYTIESDTIHFANPTWEAYENGTWDITNIPQGSIGNKVITAIWTNPVSFTITYENIRGGTNPNTVTSYTYESETILLEDPTWTEAYQNGTWNMTNIPKGSTGNKVITAIWTNPIVYTITYTNVRGGTNPNTITTYTVDSNTINFVNPTWRAYENGTWDITSIPQGSTGNKVITAVWTNPVIFTITYSNLRGGTNPNTITTYTVESETITFANPTWEDAYESGIWNISSIPQGSTGNKILVAIWSDPILYNIFFDLNGDSNGVNPNTITKYTIEDDVTLLNPYSPGYQSATWQLKNGEEISGWTAGTYLKDVDLIANWINPNRYVITFDLDGGNIGNVDYIDAARVYYSDQLPVISGTLTKKDYKFKGFISATTGDRYYDADLRRLQNWDQPNDDTLVADWERVGYYITLVQQNGTGIGGDTVLEATIGQPWPNIENLPTREGYYITGYYYKWQMESRKIYNADGTYNPDNVEFGSVYDVHENITLFCYWEPETYYYFIIDGINVRSTQTTRFDGCQLTYEDVYEYSDAPEYMDYVEYGSDGSVISRDPRGFSYWAYRLNGTNGGDLSTNPWVEFSTERVLSFDVASIVARYPDYETTDNIYFRAFYREVIDEGSGGCIADGTYITLADGSKRLVEQLTGEEMLLVWNLKTGSFDVAPILFIDHDIAQMYEVVNLYFSDGTSVKVITEHGFFDITLQKYVYLDQTASQYIGHWFNKQTTNADGNLAWTQVQLTNVVITQEYTNAWSPVTYGHLCYYVNDMLSMPGGISGLFNIFDVDSTTMKYDEEAMLSDIQTYGLFTYEEFAQLVLIPEEIFDAVGGQYLKVAMGKGMITIEDIQQLVVRYQEFF